MTTFSIDGRGGDAYKRRRGRRERHRVYDGEKSTKQEESAGLGAVPKSQKKRGKQRIADRENGRRRVSGVASAVKRIEQKRTHIRSKKAKKALLSKRKGTVADRQTDLTTTSVIVEMAETNVRVQLVAALGCCIVAICFPAASVCRETHKERIFFNGGDDLDASAVREVYAPIGGQAVLECEAGGTPAPLIHWLRNGRRIDQGGALDESSSSAAAAAVGEETLSYEGTETNDRLSTLQLSATRSKLYVDCVGHADAGAYVCVAETPTRRIAVTYRLRIETKKVFGNRERILHKNHLETHQHRKDHSVNSVASANRCFKKNQEPVPVPARIYMWTLHRVEIEGADVQLYCRSTGSGTVKVTWLDRDGEPITEHDPQYQVEENGDLLVKSISFADNMGLYRCIAENEFSTDTVETFLYPAAREKKRV